MDPTVHLKHLSVRQLIAIPLVLALFFAAAALVLRVPISRDFKGGTLVQVRELETAPEISSIKGSVEYFLGAQVDTKSTSYENKFGFDMEADNTDLPENVKAELRNLITTQLVVENEKVHVYNMGSTLTDIYKGQARNAIIGAIVAMAIIIFIAFRRRFTVGAILLTVGLDFIGVFGCMAIFRVPLSLASVAGLLMLIGYSVDTNILLTTRVLRRIAGAAREHTASAMKTGLMMSATTLTVLIALNLFTAAPALDQLSAVLIFGVIVDIVNTWFLNAGMLIWRAQKEVRREIPVSI